jgi:hypothetical protein
MADRRRVNLHRQIGLNCLQPAPARPAAAFLVPPEQPPVKIATASATRIGEMIFFMAGFSQNEF